MSFGVYLHVPYCRSVCPYCSFNVVAKSGELPHEQLACAMVAQAESMAQAFGGPLRTVYFGGGTPSLLPAAFFARMLAYLRRRFDCRALSEITVEAEPNTANQADLAALRALGVNRLSIGWQSGQDAVLARLGRKHTAAQARRLIEAARGAGFDNISVDWLIASPGQLPEEFQADLAAVTALPVAHVSCYLLTIEAKTRFAHAALRREIVPLCDDQAADWLSAAAAGLARAGLKRYEVANFARPGRMSAHNRGYWSGRPYLGLGPGAHSFARRGWHSAWRWRTRSSVAGYLRAWSGKRPALPAAKAAARQAALPIARGDAEFFETLAPSSIAFERIMLGLRRPCGVPLAEPALRGQRASLRRRSEQLCARGWARLQGDCLRPTPLGLMHADASAVLLAGD